MTHFTMSGALKAAMAAGAILSLGGCMYGGSGYYGDGYVNNTGYQCDPYAPFDDYYACDSGYGFANIGFGGGWYDQYYYPGYGISVFDRAGRRHAMRDTHRRHWARQRAQFGGRHARVRDRSPEQRAERRERRYERGEVTRDQRRGQYRKNDGIRGDRGNRPARRAARPDSDSQAAPVRNRSDRTARPPARAAKPRQATPQPSARPAKASRPARESSRRQSPRMSRAERNRINDE